MPDKSVSLTVINAETATFECIYGRGCDGVCCQQGRPPVTAEERGRIDANLGKILPLLTAAQRQAIQQAGYVSRRVKSGSPMMRVLDGWCIFFNQGCALHKAGAAEGDKFRYKPAPCSLFPLEREEGTDRYYIRQHGYKGEQWTELFCLDPGQTSRRAVKSLGEEISLAQRLLDQQRG
jgi:hypothetical protein